MPSNKTKKFLGIFALVVVGGIILTFAIGSNPIQVGAALVNQFIRGVDDPPPEIKIELKEAAKQGDFAPNRFAKSNGVLDPGDEWPAFNRTIYGDRYSHLSQINTENVSNLDVVCSLDTELLEGNQSGLIVVDGMMIYTTAEKIYSLDPTNCEINWEVHENSGLGILPVNRGPAYIDGKVIRLFQDGFMRAYNLKTGEKLWETFVSDNNHKLWHTMAPVAWNGMVFAGIAGGDIYNNRGRVLGLDVESGEVIWQTFTVPKVEGDVVHGKEGKLPVEEMKATWGNDPDVPVTGGGVWTTISVDPEKGHIYVPVGNPAPDFVKQARPGSNLYTNTMLVLDAKTGDYVNHLSIMKYDWHDWDMSNAPVFITTRGGKDILTFAPKDGHLYAFDQHSSERLYRKPKTKLHNADVEFEPEKEYYFCPGPVGGGEWNGVAFDPAHNLLFTGMNEWCGTSMIAKVDEVSKKPLGDIWFGVAYHNPFKLVGEMDSPEKWGGWIYASDADTGEWKWRARASYPTLSGLTPTAGGIIAFGDMGGTFRVLRSSDGKELYSKQFDGGMPGGMITYAINGKQYIAFTHGYSHPQWPIKPHTGKLVIMALKD